MNNKNSSSREYKGGDWDLRKNERRNAHEIIVFAERRKDERRITKMHDFYAALDDESLNWIPGPKLDE